MERTKIAFTTIAINIVQLKTYAFEESLRILETMIYSDSKLLIRLVYTIFFALMCGNIALDST